MINNVETLSNVPLIIERGADWFKSHRYREVDRARSRLGLGQRPAARQLRDRAGHPLARDRLRPRRRRRRTGGRSSAGSPGGSSRAGAARRSDLDLPYDFETMAEAGLDARLGGRSSWSTTVADREWPCAIAQFYRHESCGKCTPCREGTDWTVKMLERIDEGEATPMDLEIAAQVQDEIMGNCLCVLGDSMAMPVALDDQALPRRVRGAHRAGAARRRADGRRVEASLRWRSPGPCHAEHDASRSRSTAARCRPRGHDARRRRQARRRRDPGLLLRAEAGRAGRRLPHVPGRDRGHPEAQTACSTPGAGRHGRQHHLRPRQARAERGRRVPAGQPPARLPGLRQGRRVPAAGHRLRLGRRAARASSSPSATSRSRSSCRRSSRSTASAASSATAACASRRRSPRTTSWSSSSAATTPSSAPTTATRTSAPFSGNIIELCPVGALTSTRLPLPRAPVGHRGRRLGLHALPVAVQRRAHRPRRHQGAARARARQRGRRRRLALRQGPLRLPDRPLAASASRADGARRRRAAPGLLGARAERGRRRADKAGRAHGGAGRRRGDQRGGLPAPAA